MSHCPCSISLLYRSDRSVDGFLQPLEHICLASSKQWIDFHFHWKFRLGSNGVNLRTTVSGQLSERLLWTDRITSSRIVTIPLNPKNKTFITKHPVWGYLTDRRFHLDQDKSLSLQESFLVDGKTWSHIRIRQCVIDWKWIIIWLHFPWPPDKGWAIWHYLQILFYCSIGSSTLRICELLHTNTFRVGFLYYNSVKCVLGATLHCIRLGI